MSTETSPLLASEQPIHHVSHYATTARFLSYQAVSLISAVDGLIGVGVAGKEWAAKQVIAISRGGAIVYNDGWWAAFLLWAAGNVAGLICGVVFVVMMLHPSHYETRWTVLAKEGVFAVVSLALLAACIFATIIVATRSATLEAPNLSHKALAELKAQLGSLAYKDSFATVLFVALGWVSWLALVLSLAILSATGRHVLKNGPVLDAPKGLPERLADRFIAPILGYDTSRR